MAINIDELQELLNQAGSAVKNEKDIRKGLTRIENLLSNINTEVANVYALLDGAKPAKKERQARAPKEATAVDPAFPYGKKKDGTPKQRPGRVKAEAAA